MVAILEKSEHNADFHPMVDFIEASPLRYALTVKPTVYVSHIRQFWSTARIETTDEGTQILATVDGLFPFLTPCWYIRVKAQAIYQENQDYLVFYSSRKQSSPSESSATFLIPGGIELLEARNKSASSKRGSFDESSEILFFTSTWMAFRGNRRDLDSFGEETDKIITLRQPTSITFTNGINEVTFKTPYKDYEIDDLTSEGHDLLSSRVVLREDDYRRGCERASDLENRFFLDVDKLDPSYKMETDRINLDG
uniref:Uncharacterized protein n=1 Tax=Tanacetum cinerariifolium TaxID=118510 RepID=A0A6L2L0D9_TANCI|nr:hypothetical protein [Tanacetum cinerariifolium]